MMKKSVLATLVLTAGFSVSAVAAEDTLAKVKKRDAVKCGVNVGLSGFSSPNDKGKWSGLDADFCRAVAAATLGDASKVKFVPLTAKERFTALQSGEIDVLSRNTTWTMTRDTSLGLNFAATTYYDGQGMMVSKDLGVKSAKELDTAALCIQAGTTHELNLSDYFKVNGMKYKSVVFDTPDQTAQGFSSGRCDVLTSDQSQLYALRLKLKDPSSAIVLPEVISKEPLGPVVRQGDDNWFNIIKWTHFAMINAEELGVNSKNVDAKKSSKNPSINRLLGKSGNLGEPVGLNADWAYQIVKQVGNYGEVFEKNVGMGSPLKISRGLNALWTKGGLQYAPPIR